VEVAKLPRHVPAAFLAIEDRRFYDHAGIDPWGIARAAWSNLRSGSVSEGGSTISQQLAKLAFLSSDQTVARKLQEAVLALWLEAWLEKDEILSRYLSSVYFGDNVYGLRAAANHYFSVRPEQLTIKQAAMLAGLVKAPSRLAPTSNFEGAKARGEVVIRAMVEAGMIDARTAAAAPEPRLKRGPVKDLPSGTYFADWLFAQIGKSESYGERRIRTTLEDRLQRLAAGAIRSVGTGGAQVALVAMRPDGRVVAMVGGRSYRQSPFNRATQARRQPGSAFKLFVYLAALRNGFSPASPIQDEPIRVGDWTPDNYEGRYQGMITLRQAFAASSNVAAVRLSEEVGRAEVIQAARDLGISGELQDTPALALGAAEVSLMEMVSAYASVAHGSFPVETRGVPETEGTSGIPFDVQTREMLLELLWAAANEGTGRAAALPVQTFGKTGTTQDNRDALFIGFAGDLVTGVWIGRDDNAPLGKTVGGGLPARIWRSFMAQAVNRQAVRTTAPLAIPQATESLPDGAVPMMIEEGGFISDYDVEESSAGAGGYWPEADSYAPSEAEDPYESSAGEEPPIVIPPDAESSPAEGEAPDDRAPPRREVPTIAAPPGPSRPVEDPAVDEGA
jgi:penicillin-binding protein 1A